MSLDPYSVLGVAKTASDDEIKKVYRKKAKALHPDQHPDDEKKNAEFKRVSAAYEILGDKKKRAQYDRGEIDGEGNPRGFAGGGPNAGFGGGGSYRGGNPFQSTHGDPFEDILSGMFGGGGGRRRNPGPQKGRDLRYRIDVTFEDAVNGARRRMDMGDGRALDVNIPAGIESGQTLRLKSQGQGSQFGGPPGDALLEVTVRDSNIWEREGNNLRMGVPVDLRVAVMGGSVDVKTPSGTVTLKVPAGSNTGTVLRLRNKGVQTKTPGHLFARLEIVLDDPKDAGLVKWAKSSG